MPGRTALALCTLAALLLPAPAAAQNNPNVNLNDFAPSVHAWDVLNVSGTKIAPDWQPNAGMWMLYRSGALALSGVQGNTVNIISDQLVGDFYASIPIKGWASVGIGVPLFFMSAGDDPVTVAPHMTQASGASLGDVRLSGKVRFWDTGNRGVGVGLGQDLTVPTATGDKLTGEQSVTSRTYFIWDFNHQGWSAAVNLGYFARTNEENFAPPIQDEFHMGASVVVPIICDDLELLFATHTRTSASDPFGGPGTTATAFLGGLRGRLMDSLVLSAAGGSGTGSMPGNPVWQAMMQVGWSPVANSCDEDGDGICDNDDRCPELPGPEPSYGCPDKDLDGTLDSNDRCPTEHGKLHLRGCPDRDDDNVPDDQDRCPDNSGPPGFRGCPDIDGDDIVDMDDQCPDDMGMPEFNGCPDTDEDGIIDSEDKCPDNAGPKKTQGCPDADEDGLKDADDKCPDTWGTLQHNGCPPPTPKKVKVTAKKIVILDKVYFGYNKATIKYKSHGILRDVASVLKDNSWVKKVRIEGHTDDKGKREYNLELSQRRAQSVVDFLINEGVESERLEAVGYGPDKPLVEGTSHGAREQNRRVEFSIIDPE